MSNRVVPLLSDEEPNPYNKNKDYNTDAGEAVTQSADNLWVAPKKKPKQTEPDKATSADGDNVDHDYKKRWSDLKKTYDEKVSTYREEIEQLKKQVSQTAQKNEQITAPETVEELEKFKKENPDLFRMVEQVANLKTEQSTKGLKEQLEDISKREKAIARDQAKAAVKKAHSDFDTIIASDEFHTWAESQPEALQKMIYENPNDSRALIRALDFYKADTGFKKEVQPTNSLRDTSSDDGSDTLVSTRSSQEPNPNGKKIWSRAEIAKMPPHVFDKYEAEIDLAIYEGRITN